MVDEPELSDEEPSAATKKKVRRRQIVQLVVVVGLLVLIFGVVLPQFIDYGDVWDAVASLSAEQFAVLFLLGLVRIGVNSGQYASVIPGLKLWDSLRSYLAANSVAEFAPPPADLAIRFGMYRALGIDAERASVGIILSGLFDNAAKMAIPVIALLALIAAGSQDELTWELAAIGVTALLGATVLVVLAMRSEKFTVKFGEWVGHVISWFLVKFRRNPLAELGSKAAGVRARIGDTLRRRWPIATVAVIGTHVMSYVIMLTALRFLGVGADEVDWVSLLVAYALVIIVTMLPLTPGGIGVAALGYSAILAEGDPALATQIVAASFLSRVFMWFLPIIVGFIPLALWRRQQSRREVPGPAPAG